MDRVKLYQTAALNPQKVSTLESLLLLMPSTSQPTAASEKWMANLIWGIEWSVGYQETRTSFWEAPMGDILSSDGWMFPVPGRGVEKERERGVERERECVQNRQNCKQLWTNPRQDMHTHTHTNTHTHTHTKWCRAEGILICSVVSNFIPSWTLYLCHTLYIEGKERIG